MKRMLIAISCIVMAMVMCISLVSCSHAGKEIDATTTSASDEASKEQGGKADDANTTEAKQNGKDDKATTKPVTDKDGKPVTATTSAKQDTTKQATTKKKKTTTTTTQEYYMSTTSRSGAIITPEESLDDDYPYTASQIQAYMETKYDKSKYVINVVEKKTESAKLVVFNLKDGTIYSIANASLKTGKVTETNKKTGKKVSYNVD